MDEPIWIDYPEFGERFVAQAVTVRRIEAAIAGITDRGLTIGPFSLGPAGLAGFVAEGRLGRPEVVRRGPEVVFDTRIPAFLTLKVLVGGKKLRVEAGVFVGLTLHARTADPLLIVIDIPRVHPDDVNVVLRARAEDSKSEWLLDPIAGRLRREIAKRVNALLADPSTRRRRIYDIEAIVAGVRSEHRTRTEFDWIDYAEFGRRFFPRIVTRERVFEVVGRLSGRGIAVGPFRTGPRASAQVEVHGEIGAPELSERSVPVISTDVVDTTAVQFDLLVPVSLDITVDVLKANHYRAELAIPLVLTARAAAPLWIVVEAEPPAPADIHMEFAADGLRAAALGAVAKIKKQVIGQVVRFVERELADPTGRTVDVAERIDRLL
ncbi:hypothetical protein [Nocardia paucivorans]|uniref:hypothetical protein n=1 Tax=Nocardia paucivorans TaxID=114259 RepID=UPI001FE22A65|nr:hypothetical protein [Nocardia paucivorans]